MVSVDRLLFPLDLLVAYKNAKNRGGSRGGCRGCAPPPPDDLRFSTGILQKKKKTWFIGVEVEQKTSAPPP